MNTPTGLQCESAVNPRDVDCAPLRFSWFLSLGGQSAGSMEVHNAHDHYNTASLFWQIEWVSDPETLDSRYMRLSLAAWTPYGWQVRSRLADGLESPWSECAHFATGPLGSDDLQVQWITREESPKLPFSSYFHNGIRPDQPVYIRSGDEYAGVCLHKEFSVAVPVSVA